MVSGNSGSSPNGGFTEGVSSSNCQTVVGPRLPRSVRTHLALLSTTLIAMGAVSLYRSTIRHSRSSPPYISNLQVAISVHSERTIVKSSIPCGISAVLPGTSGLPKPKISSQEPSGAANDYFFLIWYRRPIFQRENGEGLSGFAILGNSKAESGAFR